MTEIIEATPAYISDVAAAEAENFSAPWTREQIADEMAKENSLFLIALTDGEFSGYISGDIILGEVYINNLAVKKEYRRRGIGKAILSEFISRLRGNDLVTLEVRVSNVAARTLYEGLGFENLGERKNFYSAPAENACIYTLYL